MMRFQKLDVQVMTCERLMSVQEKAVVLMKVIGSQVHTLPADTVVLALGVRSNDEMLSDFEAAFDNVILLGDADSPGRIAEATFTGLGRASTF